MCTGATTFTLFLHLVMMYIFDLYNPNGTFQSRDSALRATLAVGVARVFCCVRFLFSSPEEIWPGNLPHPDDPGLVPPKWVAVYIGPDLSDFRG